MPDPAAVVEAGSAPWLRLAVEAVWRLRAALAGEYGELAVAEEELVRLHLQRMTATVRRLRGELRRAA